MTEAKPKNDEAIIKTILKGHHDRIKNLEETHEKTSIEFGNKMDSMMREINRGHKNQVSVVRKIEEMCNGFDDMCNRFNKTGKEMEAILHEQRERETRAKIEQERRIRFRGNVKFFGVVASVIFSLMGCLSFLYQFVKGSK